MKQPVFKGSCTALITPFANDRISYPALEKNIDRQYENGTSAIVVCGTTGENASLSQAEHDELIRFAVNRTAGRMKVIAGIGSNNTSVALRNAENARAAGADAVLMVTPYYNKTSQMGLIRHFEYVADRVEIPVILYNVPSRTGIGIAPETYKALSAHPNINGVKEASGSISLTAEIRSSCGDELNIWSGNDDCTVAMMALGAAGVISVASNIIPGIIAKLCALSLSGDHVSAEALQSRYLPLMNALFIETNPIPVKAAMKLMELDSGELRLPLIDIGEEHLAALKAAMYNVGLNV